MVLASLRGFTVKCFQYSLSITIGTLPTSHLLLQQSDQSYTICSQVTLSQVPSPKPPHQSPWLSTPFIFTPAPIYLPRVWNQTYKEATAILNSTQAKLSNMAGGSDNQTNKGFPMEYSSHYPFYPRFPYSVKITQAPTPFLLDVNSEPLFWYIVRVTSPFHRERRRGGKSDWSPRKLIMFHTDQYFLICYHGNHWTPE